MKLAENLDSCPHDNTIIVAYKVSMYNEAFCIPIRCTMTNDTYVYYCIILWNVKNWGVCVYTIRCLYIGTKYIVNFIVSYWKSKFVWVYFLFENPNLKVLCAHILYIYRCYGNDNYIISCLDFHANEGISKNNVHFYLNCICYSRVLHSNCSDSFIRKRLSYCGDVILSTKWNILYVCCIIITILGAYFILL